MRSNLARLQPSMSIMERNHSTLLRAARSSFRTASKFPSPQVRLASTVATYLTVHSKLWAIRQLSICPSISSTREHRSTILPNRECFLTGVLNGGRNHCSTLRPRALCACPLLKDEPTWLGSGPRSENDPLRTCAKGSRAESATMVSASIDDAGQVTLPIWEYRRAVLPCRRYGRTDT